MKQTRNSLLYLAAFIFPLYVLAQSGDEDKEIVKRAKVRDQEEIDKAVKGLPAEGKPGWWTESMKNHDQRIAWWREAKFGMFVHWGVYSLPGGEWKGNKVSGYAEHLMRKEKIPRAGYLELAHQFNPVNFNADEWIRAAKNAGMKYFVITSKHHDGFAMFDSKVSDYNVVRQTAFARDPMAELSAACKKYGLKFGFYYSHAYDWEHPDAPGNDWEYNNPGGDKNVYGGPKGEKNWFDYYPEKLPKAVKYVDEKAIPQIKELLQKYHPDILWFDTPGKLPLSENIRILQAIREVDDHVVVNGRLARSAAISFGDYKNTSDRPAEFYPVEGDWEAIPTTNESYGYHQYDLSHKPAGHFIRLMANAASRGGNLLMNIGPKGNGRMDDRDLVILNGIGRWMTTNGESIYGTTVSPLALQSWGTTTRKKNRLYLHVFQWPSDGGLIVGGLKSDLKNAYLLADPARKPLTSKRLNTSDVIIDLPGNAPDSVNSVVVLETEGRIETDPARLLTGNKTTQRLLAYDAQQKGSGFRYGDGKTDRYYVEGWDRVDQSLSWTVRVNETMKFKANLKYIASTEGGGEIRMVLNGRSIFDKVLREVKRNGPEMMELGELTLRQGVNELVIEPLSVKGQEIMKLLEMDLVPSLSGK